MRLLFFIAAAACCLLWVDAASAAAAAPPPPRVQRAFEEGNRHYAEGAYEAALQQYGNALDSGWASGALYYNVAGAHYRLGHAGQAVRYYEKARRLLPGNERLRHNLSIVRSQIEAPPPAPPSLWAATQERLTALMPAAAYLAGGLLLYLAALAWWVRRSVFGEETSLRPSAGVATLLAVGLLVAGLGLALSAPPTGEKRAVALRGPLALLRAPAAEADSAAAALLPEGTVLRLTGQRDGWRRVRSARGEEGWTRADALGEI